ncbi:MAG TPA: thymidylate synthase [Leptolyngbyaceae cyanobacterium M33_DOE_097]|uniref:Thymidylate synthase n=1 Tax=Oscillatoriales cyanobacterium SpSt-418 TaxID=2282169 RepID=A0A7C3KEM9_9CYAN|nr:thymidylate synthase [Leptolyngbyaceae cyanobacterium M33_DOE_097]
MVTAKPALEFQYKPLFKNNQIVCGTGQTAIVTGWTLKQAVARHLEPCEFAAIGQLYSPTRGISFLLRNLLANPHVRYLVVMNGTREDRNAGASRCLLDFFAEGFREGISDTGQPCWVVNSEITGYIDAEIPKAVLEQLRQAIATYEATSGREAVRLVKELAQRPGLEPWGEPQLRLPLHQVQPTVLPGPRYGHRIEGRTIAETWVKIIHRIKTTGTIRPNGYDGHWQELIDLTAIVTHEPENFYFPEPNYLPVDRPFVEQYVAQILDDAHPEEGVKYTYGQRLRSWFHRDQIKQVIHKLTADPNSARAVMSLWDPQEDAEAANPPCLNHIWTRIVDGELSLTATFRSNDMFSAWVANAIGLRALQQHLRDKIQERSGRSLTLGPLITVSQSAHIYDDCWENADRIIATQYPKICQQRDYSDPSGSFVITLQADEILVEHMTPGSGEVVNCHSGKTAQQLYQQIATASPGLQVEHALYLGAELQKAELSLKHPEFVYEQDKPLRQTSPSQSSIQAE